LIDHKKLNIGPKGDQEFSHSLVALASVREFEKLVSEVMVSCNSNIAAAEFSSPGALNSNVNYLH